MHPLTAKAIRCSQHASASLALLLTFGTLNLFESLKQQRRRQVAEELARCRPFFLVEAWAVDRCVRWRSVLARRSRRMVVNEEAVSALTLRACDVFRYAVITIFHDLEQHRPIEERLDDLLAAR